MALSARPYGKVLNYEQYIDHQLQLTRSKIKTIDVLTAALALFVTALGVLFLEVLLDHAFGLPLTVREVVLFAGLAAGGFYTFRRVLLPLVRRVNGLYAARTIEADRPGFKNSLINY